MGTGVVSVTRLAAGEGAYNVVPDRRGSLCHAEGCDAAARQGAPESSGKLLLKCPDRSSFGGTLRSLSHEHLMRLKRRVTEVSARISMFPLSHVRVYG